MTNDTDKTPLEKLAHFVEEHENESLQEMSVPRNLIEQILTEVKVGNYDMICMGSPYSTHSLRQLYTPNITAEIAELVHCPVMTARYKPS